MSLPFDSVGLNAPVVNLSAGTVTLSWTPIVANQTPPAPGLEALEGLLVNLVSVSIQRRLYGSQDWTTIASSAGADFAGSTYTDTPPTGSYGYQLVVAVSNQAKFESAQTERTGLDEGVGAPFPQPGLSTAPAAGVLSANRTSNEVSASTLNSVTLTASVLGNQVTLSWSVGAGEVVNTQVFRSDGPVVKAIRELSGRMAPTYSELIATGAGSLQYYVVVTVQDKDASTTATIQSNTVTVSPVASAQDEYGHS